MLVIIWKAAIMFYDFYDSGRSEATMATDGDTRLAATPSRWLARAILVNIHTFQLRTGFCGSVCSSVSRLSLHHSSRKALKEILRWKEKENHWRKEKNTKKN